MSDREWPRVCPAWHASCRHGLLMAQSALNSALGFVISRGILYCAQRHIVLVGKTCFTLLRSRSRTVCFTLWFAVCCN